MFASRNFRLKCKFLLALISRDWYNKYERKWNCNFFIVVKLHLCAMRKLNILKSKNIALWECAIPSHHFFYCILQNAKIVFRDYFHIFLEMQSYNLCDQHDVQFTNCFKLFSLNKRILKNFPLLSINYRSKTVISIFLTFSKNLLTLLCSFMTITAMHFSNGILFEKKIPCL